MQELCVKVLHIISLLIHDIKILIFLDTDTQHFDCNDGELRLEGGVDNAIARTGRLEICFNQAWGTVCNTSFSVPDAIIACSQLIGFESEGNIPLTAQY